MMSRSGPILCVALALAASGCSSDRAPAPPTSASRSAASSASSASSEAPTSGVIPQPDAPADLAVADESTRADLAMPTFSDPTAITNPLFPVSSQQSVLLLGTVDDQPFRTEVTLLPTTRVLEWEGQQVETLVSQYVAFLDGRIQEVAYDLYAQADDGSVWYFGEDVFNFADGAIVDTHGTWIAGVDGPAAMIMPADPQVGDVYRPENIPGFVFEEVTVQSVGETLDGPLGSVEGGTIIHELHMDGATEDKTFAPGYGEFYTGGGGDVEALAMAIPTDAASEAVPTELETLATGGMDAIDATASEDWAAATSAADEVSAAWEAFASAHDVPRLIEPLMAGAVEALGSAVADEDADRGGQAAIEVARMAFDLQLRHRAQVEIELARFDLWLAQLRLDAAAGDAALVNGDHFALDYVRERFVHSLDPADTAGINLALEELLGAIGDEDYAAVEEISAMLREVVAEVSPSP